MGIYAILLLACLSILSFIMAGSGRFNSFPPGAPIPPELEYYELFELERRRKIMATIIFAIILLFLFLLAKYGLRSLPPF